MVLKGDTIFKEKLITGLINDTWNLVNFTASIRKSENLSFDGIILPIAIKFQLKIDRRITSQVNWRETGILFEKSLEKFGEF